MEEVDIWKKPNLDLTDIDEAKEMITELEIRYKEAVKRKKEKEKLEAEKTGKQKERKPMDLVEEAEKAEKAD